MSDIPYIIENIKKVKGKINALNTNLLKYHVDLDTFNEQLKDACPHPKEYFKRVGEHYNNDYGKLCNNDDYEYECIFCHKTFRRDEVE